MVVLCARFAFLACLCSLVAINLSPARAAYIEARHRNGEQVAHPYSAVSEQRREEPPTLYMRDDPVSKHGHHHKSTKTGATKTHTGKGAERTSTRKGHSGHAKAHKEGSDAHPLAGLRNFVHAQSRRTMGLPPRGFVGRAHDRDHEHEREHDHHHEHEHGHDHDRDHNHEHNKRDIGHDHGHAKALRSVFARRGRHSSVFVPGADGKKYIVSPMRSEQRMRTDKGKPSRHGHGRRQSSEVLGTIDIMVPGGQRIASLVVDPSPTNSTSGQNTTQAFPLSASTTNQTQFLMTLVDVPNDAAGGSSKNVAIVVPVFDATYAQSVPYCATYDPNPIGSSELVMAPCMTSSSSTADASSTGATSPIADVVRVLALDPHRSQVFSYDPASGQIQPTSVGSHTPAEGNSTVTASSGPATSSTSTATAPSPTSSQQAQNVTLVFVPANLEVPAQVAAASSTPTATDSPAGNEAVVTTTVTETVITTVTASGVSSTTTPSATTTSTTSGAETTTVTSSTSSSAQSTFNEPLEIEVAPVVPTPTATSTTATSSVTRTSSSSTTPNAPAVASTVANASTRTTSSTTTNTSSR